MISYYGFATQLFGNFVDKYASSFAFLRKQLPQANIRISFRAYISTMVLTTLLGYILSLMGLMVFFNFFNAGLMKIFYIILGPVAVASTCLILFILAPIQKVSSRRRTDYKFRNA